MPNRGFHVEILQGSLFAGDGQERIGVRRQINADNVPLLVRDKIDEARVLVRESVVILSPYVGCQQVVQRGDGPAPGNLSADLQPFGVLIEHRIHNVDKGLVAGEKTVAASEKIALKPSLTGVLRISITRPPGGRCSSVLSVTFARTLRRAESPVFP